MIFDVDKHVAEQGLPDFQFRLGFHYDCGFGVDEDKAEAVKWWRKAAEQKHADAQCHLAQAYFLGEGIAKDEAG